MKSTAIKHQWLAVFAGLTFIAAAAGTGEVRQANFKQLKETKS